MPGPPAPHGATRRARSRPSASAPRPRAAGRHRLGVAGQLGRERLREARAPGSLPASRTRRPSPPAARGSRRRAGTTSCPRPRGRSPPAACGSRSRSHSASTSRLAPEEVRRVLLREAREPRVRAPLLHLLQDRRPRRRLRAPPRAPAPGRAPTWKRSSRRFSRHRRTIPSSAGGIPRSTLDSSAGVSSQDRRQRRRPPCPAGTGASAPAARTAPPRARRCPTAWSTGSARTCSGDMYATVPITHARAPSGDDAVGSSLSPASRSTSLARPKSRIFTRPSVVRNRFSGLRSRWTIPFAWAAARPCATCTAKPRTCRCVGERREQHLAQRLALEQLRDDVGTAAPAPLRPAACRRRRRSGCSGG